VSGASQTRAYLALLAIVALWGSFPATTKLALADFPPFFLAAVRCTVAACFLLVLLARSPSDTIRGLGPGAVKAFLILGAAGIWGSMQFTYLAIYYTTAGNAVILQAATPITVALIARLYLGERLQRAQWLGVAASVLGVLLVSTRGRLGGLQTADLHAGDFITLASLCSWAVYTVYGKRVLASARSLRGRSSSSRACWVRSHTSGGTRRSSWWGRARPRSSRTFSRSWGSCWPRSSWGSASRIWQVVGTLLVLAGVALTTRRPLARSGAS